MTINERVSPETLDKIIEAADEVIRALAAEIKQYRAAAKPACYALTNSAGEVYNTHSSPENADAYRWLIHQSDDSLTLRVTPLYAAPQVTSVPELAVWYGSMPESNGKTNWTAILYRKGEGIEDGFTIDRSEYPDRVRYAADRVRYLIGEIAERPYILNYDADEHSGYTAAPAVQAEQLSGNTEQVSQPALPEGYALVPSKLTADNGAKGLLSGEFSETKYINCPECFGDDECETCDGSGRIEITVPVSWTTIKEIWAKGVEHFAAAPQQEAQEVKK